MKRHILPLGLVLAAALTPLAAQTPVVAAVTSAASYEFAIAPGGLIAIWGSNLAPTAATATAIPLPRKLGETTVSVDGVDIPLLAVGPNQVNAQLPFEATKSRASLVVTTAAGKSAAYALAIVSSAPALFTLANNGQGRAHVYDGAFQPVNEVRPGATVILYATGLGVTNPPATTGAGGSGQEPLNRAVTLPEVWLGEVKSDPSYVGLTPWPGVFQINVTLPRTALASDRLYLRAKNWQSNVTSVGLPAAEVAATGSIHSTYPVAEDGTGPTGGGITYSPVYVGGRFTLRLNVEAGKTYQIAAAGEGGQVLIDIRADGTYEAEINVPPVNPRHGDFGDPSMAFPTIDFLAGGQSMPADIVPASRLDPRMTTAYGILQFPNMAPRSIGRGIYWTSGVVPASGPFVLDDSNRPELTQFGGFINLGYGTRRDKSFVFRLFVNGKEIASKTVNATILGR